MICGVRAVSTLQNTSKGIPHSAKSIEPEINDAATLPNSFSLTQREEWDGWAFASSRCHNYNCQHTAIGFREVHLRSSEISTVTLRTGNWLNHFTWISHTLSSSTDREVYDQPLIKLSSLTYSSFRFHSLLGLPSYVTFSLLICQT